MELRGLKINIKKTKYMFSGKISANKVNWGKWPCGCCGKGVGSNSILCNKCKKWCHKRCSGSKNIFNKNFIYPKFNFAKFYYTNDSETSFKLKNGEVVEVVESFNYLRNFFDCNTPHLFTCSKISTTLGPESLWTDPVRAAELLDHWTVLMGT